MPPAQEMVGVNTERARDPAPHQAHNELDPHSNAASIFKEYGEREMKSKERRAARRAAQRSSALGEEATFSSIRTPFSGEDSTYDKSRPQEHIATSAITDAKMNAKERRAARRALEKTAASKATDDQVSPLTPAIWGTSTKTIFKGDGLNAKERRAARRAAERMNSVGRTASIPDVNPGNTTAPGTSVAMPSRVADSDNAKGTTAKERRAARRAAEREAGDLNFQGSSTIGKNGETPQTTAKERRLARREEERQKRRRGCEEVSSKLLPPAKKHRRAAKNIPHIVFVGQLAFSTTAAALEDHFRKRGRVQGNVIVRLLTKKGTNPPRSKGMAFVEVEDADSAYQCLSLHHTRLDGRLLNVERTSGGGKTKKGERIEEKRGEQKEFMKSVVQRVLGEFVEAGKLGEGELDDAAKGVLEKMEAKVMERAVKDYCDKPDRLDLHNPSAWFTHHAHQLAFREDPENLEISARDWLEGERIKAGGRERDRRKAVAKGRGSGHDRGRGRGFNKNLKRGGDLKKGGAAQAGTTSDSRHGHYIERVPDEQEVTGNDVSASNSNAVDGDERDKPNDCEPERVFGAQSNTTTSPGTNSAKEPSASPEDFQRGRHSDLASIFPSLRGRGGGRGGTRGGRGGGVPGRGGR